MSDPTEEDLKAAREWVEWSYTESFSRAQEAESLARFRAQAREAAEAKLHDADRQYLLLKKERDEARARTQAIEDRLAETARRYQAVAKDAIDAKEAAEARLRELREALEETVEIAKGLAPGLSLPFAEGLLARIEKGV